MKKREERERKKRNGQKRDTNKRMRCEYQKNIKHEKTRRAAVT